MPRKTRTRTVSRLRPYKRPETPENLMHSYELLPLLSRHTLMSHYHSLLAHHPSYAVNYKFSGDESAYTGSAMDFEDPKKKKGMFIFTSLQGAAAVQLMGAGLLTGDFSQNLQHFLDTIDEGTTVTGGGNAVRNLGWYQSHSRLPQNLAQLVTKPQRLLARLLNSAAKFSYSAVPWAKKLTLPLSDWLRRKSREHQEKAQTRQDRIENFTKSFIGRDIVHARINSIFAGMGAAIHVPQTWHGALLTMQTGMINGYFAGGLCGITAYGLVAADQFIEQSRLKPWASKLPKDTGYDHETSHILAGYVAREEYFRDFLFKWLPPGFFMGKGGCYVWEAEHMQSLNETFNHLASGHIDSVTVAATLMRSAGIVFAASPAHEFWEANGNKITYMAQKANIKVNETMINGVFTVLNTYNNKKRYSDTLALSDFLPPSPEELDKEKIALDALNPQNLNTTLISPSAYFNKSYPRLDESELGEAVIRTKDIIQDIGMKIVEPPEDKEDADARVTIAYGDKHTPDAPEDDDNDPDNDDDSDSPAPTPDLV